MTGTQNSGYPVNPETLIRVRIENGYGDIYELLGDDVVAVRDILGNVYEYGWCCDDETEDAIVRLLNTARPQIIYGQDARYTYELAK